MTPVGTRSAVQGVLGMCLPSEGQFGPTHATVTSWPGRTGTTCSVWVAKVPGEHKSLLQEDEAGLPTVSSNSSQGIFLTFVLSQANGFP